MMLVIAYEFIKTEFCFTDVTYLIYNHFKL